MSMSAAAGVNGTRKGMPRSSQLFLMFGRHAAASVKILHAAIKRYTRVGHPRVTGFMRVIRMRAIA